jgi:FkbM family methyltransferase
MGVLKQIANQLPHSLRDPLLKAWREYRGNPDLHALRLLAIPSKLALDIGANAGTYARELARHASGCVAFEPVPDLAMAIGEKLRDAGVTVHPWAVSDRTGHITLRIPLVDGGDVPAYASVEPNDLSIGEITRDVEVPCYRLDDLKFDPVGVIKIDAEGHEEAVLRGATALIERDRPNILLEADEHRHKPGCVAAIRHFFSERGYEGFFILGRRLMPIADFDLAHHQSPSSLDSNKMVIFNRPYVDTFIFASDPSTIARLHSIANTGQSL